MTEIIHATIMFIVVIFLLLMVFGVVALAPTVTIIWLFPTLDFGLVWLVLTVSIFLATVRNTKPHG